MKKARRIVRISRYVIYKETSFDALDHLWTFMGSFTGIALIGFLQSFYFELNDNLFLIGSFGATSVLIYGAIHSPLAQPRNVIGGHLISAFIGVTIGKFLPDITWLSAALAVSLSIVFMQITKTLHPPGGATALIAVIGSEKIKNLGYMYLFSPVLSGIIIMLTVALVFNNLSKNRHYPSKKK